MSKPKGGRGIKAPYETTHVRVPLPIKAEVERLSLMYREQGEISAENSLTGLSDAMVIAKKILIQKKSAKVSLEKLLTAIYGDEVSL